jgi:hypothetical protein
MNENVKNSAVDVAADMLIREFGFGTAMAERIARRVMSVVLPPLEKEVERLDAKRESALLATSRHFDQNRYVLDRFGQTIESMLNYARSIGGRHGHYVDVPIDDRTAYELEGLLRSWQQAGGNRYRPASTDRVEWAGIGIDYARDDIKFARRDDLFKNGPTMSQVEELSRHLRMERITLDEKPPGGNRRPTEA